MNSTATYAVGVLTTPSVIAFAFAARGVTRYATKRVRDIKAGNIYFHDSRTRSYNAAAIMYAPKFAAINLPGGIVLAWRSKVRWRTDIVAHASRIRDLGHYPDYED